MSMRNSIPTGKSDISLFPGTASLENKKPDFSLYEIKDDDMLINHPFENIALDEPISVTSLKLKSYTPNADVNTNLAHKNSLEVFASDSNNLCPIVPKFNSFSTTEVNLKLTDNATTLGSNVDNDVNKTLINTKDDNRVKRPDSSFAYNHVCYMLNRYNLKRIDETIYCYEKNRGVYTLLTLNKLKTLARTNVSREISCKLNKFEMADIIERLQTEPSIEIDINYFDRDENLVCFNNGTLDIRTKIIREHSAENKLTTCINATYNPNYTLSNTIFKKFLTMICNNDQDKMTHMQEIVGYLLSSNNRAKKAVLFNGVRHSGKSTLLRVIIDIIGKSSVSNFSMGDLNKRFTTGKLLTKKLNIFGERGVSVQKDIEVFKAMTGRDWIETEDKGKDFISRLAKTKLLFAGNSLPNFEETEDTEAFMDRITLFLFSYSIPIDERIQDFDDLLLEERDVIVSWAMDGLMRLHINNYVFSEVKDAVKLRRSKLTQVGPIDSFLNDSCIISPSLRVFSTTLYSQYLHYCHDNLFEPYGKGDFITRIIAKTEGLGVQHKKIRIKDQAPLMGFAGLDIKKDNSQTCGTTEQLDESA